MRALQVLGAIYIALYLITGAVIGVSNAPELIGWVWIPFGSMLLVFYLSAPRETGPKRATCGLLVGAIAGSAAGSAVLSVLAALDELDLIRSEVFTGAAWMLAGGTALTVLVLVTARVVDKLRAPGRSRGLVELAAAPSLVVVASAALAGAVMLLTPPIPEVFLDGLFAMISLFWCGLAAVWLAGAWIIVLRARKMLDPPPLPTARVT